MMGKSLAVEPNEVFHKVGLLEVIHRGNNFRYNENRGIYVFFKSLENIFD